MKKFPQQHSEEAIPYLRSLAEWLHLEKKADLERFRQEVESKPLEERRQKGYSWYPVVARKTGYTYGDRAYVEIERTKGLELDHHFKSGKPVRLFSRQPEIKRPHYTGVVYWVHGDRMRIVLNSRDLPSWLEMGSMGVDLQFDETTYLEMEKALGRVIAARGDRLAEIRDTFAGLIPIHRSEKNARSGAILNPSQEKAISGILSSSLISLVHGPPGTGKTTTLVQAIREMAQTEFNILVAAPSNTAADVLTERLATSGMAVVRIGNISRIDEAVVRHTLEVQLAEHPESKHIKKLKKQAAEKRRHASRHKRRFGQAERIQRRDLFREAAELQKWARQLEDRLIQLILDNAQAIVCTLVGASHPLLEKRKFRTVLIDEAAQALEPATWIPILKASRVVLAGDPLQLPPTLKSPEAAQKGLGTTLLERAIDSGLPSHLLDIQYRMHESIMGFSNLRFYRGKLKADEMVKTRTFSGLPHAPVLFIDTVGCGFEEKRSSKTRSVGNTGEILILEEHFLKFKKIISPEEAGLIALISPYREQVEKLEETLGNSPNWEGWNWNVQTIDGFQGQEADMVYISLVRSNRKGELGFLKDYRRMNVALTRARKLLVVIGDSGTLGRDPFYLDFLEYVDKNGTYQTAWEYLQDQSSASAPT
jgi:superfamily I DNA and/or RNA helicase